MFNTPFAFMKAATAAASYLLDTYGGAKVAYSVRRLSSTYTGNALRVRRASDNAEQNIGFVGEDLDTSALTTFCSGTDGFVTTWYDQSGNGIDATQPTAANQSTIVSAGVVITEGTKPAIYCSAPRSAMTYTEFTAAGDDMAQVLVGNRQGTGTGNNLVGHNNSASGVSDPLFAHFNDTLYTWDGLNISYIEDLSSAYSVYFGSSSTSPAAIFWRNGVNKTPLTISSAVTRRKFNQILRYSNNGDPNNDSKGNVQETILWLSDQTANAAGISSNANAYYSIY
jgi:hypothetical protein